jgi:outer membrane protein OmpA-like peptidoglycan-associated protein
MESTDQFATSKANLRDTIKWLATTIAALAALVVAGTPFSAFGTLELLSGRFVIAAAGLLVAASCLLLVWLRLLDMLRSDAVFPTQLRSTYIPPSERADREEIDDLRKHLADHGGDLLPTGVGTFDDLESVVAGEWATANAAPGNAALMERYKGYSGNVEMYLNYSTFARLHRRVERNVRFVVGLTALAIVALFSFAYAANPPKTVPADRIVVVQTAPVTAGVGGTQQALGPVRFELGSARLERSALNAIVAARAFLREHETAGLVLLAHTDTTGGEQRNRTLAAERGAAVRRVLLQEGGIAASRVFIAELPKTDLPTLTLPQMPEADNRAVEFLVVTVPARK